MTISYNSSVPVPTNDPSVDQPDMTINRSIIKSPSNAQISDNLLIDYINRFWTQTIYSQGVNQGLISSNTGGATI